MAVWKEKDVQSGTAQQKRAANCALIVDRFPALRFCRAFSVCGSGTHSSACTRAQESMVAKL